jgi:WD40 repeat protein/tRNA A-37 threonylcarbamoyl transferase component Bud32
MASEILCGYCGTPNQPTESFCENCGAELNVVPPPPAPLPAPTLLNQRYRVLNEIGKGGFGIVYRVEDTHFDNRILAAKKLQLDSNMSAQDLKTAQHSFANETRLLPGLMHPNLPRVYDSFSEGISSYLIMDFIEGHTLGELLQKTLPALLPLEWVLQIGVELTIVLDYLHMRQPPIIFRDLNPNNIIITDENAIYLIDFGIARHLSPGEKKHTENLGTPGYISPEHYSLATALSDIYSLGAIMHQLLSGEDPSTYSLFQYPELHSSGHVQAKLASLIMRMLERDPQKRPASAAEVKQKLQQILQELQQPASKVNTTPQKKTVVLQGPLPIQAIPTSNAPQQKPPKSPAPLPRTRGELLHTYTQHTAAIYTLAWSPDGSKLASAGEDCQVCVWQALTGKTIFTYQKHTGSVRALAWSPNSKYVASAGNDHTVQIWQAQDGQSFSTYQGHRRWVQALSWSPDAKLVASGDANGQVHLWNPRTGQQHLTYQQHHASIYALSFSPDGTLLASGDEDGAIHIWESAGLSLRALCTIHQRKISALAWSPDGTLIASSSEDRKDHALHIWRATTGTQVAAYAAHQRMVNALAWSPANKRLASAGRDQTVQILDPQTGNTLFTYRGHTSSINALAWSPDGNTLASAGDERAVQVWWAN